MHHEGEQTIARLLEMADNEELTIDGLVHEPGVAYRLDGNTCVNHPRPPIENLDELPLPARDLIDMDRYPAPMAELPMATHRSRWPPPAAVRMPASGARDSVHGDGFRQRSPESVAAEMKQLKERYAVESIRMIDDVDGIDRTWIDQWATAAQELDAVIPFEALNKLTRTDLPLLEVRDSL